MADGLRAVAYDRTFRGVMSLTERDLVPDLVLRAGIRRLLAARAAEASAPGGEARAERLQAFVDELRALPIAVQTKEANEQHYEVPTEYYLKALGPRRKYSSCLYADKGTTLAEAEETMLALCAARAGLADGQDVLELGCGWGSWCLWTAARFPRSQVTAVSNSHTQKTFIDAEATRQGLKNLTVVTADVVTFAPPPGAAFDRVVSVEMFEHMKARSGRAQHKAGSPI
jgi:cyclopropane-fatty-acyl-phospholipid synthase